MLLGELFVEVVCTLGDGPSWLPCQLTTQRAQDDLFVGIGAGRSTRARSAVVICDS